MKYKHLLAILTGILLISISCTKTNKKNDLPTKVDRSISEDSLLTLIQYQTFQYFWEGADSISGMALERIHLDNIYPVHNKNVITSGGSGFGLMAIIVGIERGFITRSEGIKRFEKNITFLENADSFHGVWPHWWNPSGKVVAFSKMDNGGDLVETSFLAAGLLTVRQYLLSSNAKEAKLINRINTLWQNIEFDWHTKGENNGLYWHWSPTYGWQINFKVRGYNEALIMYVLAASSPTHGINKNVYHQGWARNGDISNDTMYYGLPTELDHYDNDNSPVGPLFWAHYSFLGLNPTNLEDQYGNYWKLTNNHVLIHYTHCLENLSNYKGYGANCWGLTSSYSMKGYAAHKPDDDLGVISPTAALSSFPYTPQKSMAMLKYLYFDADSLVGKYGPYDAFSFEHNWYVRRYLAIDQGPIPIMIENYRTGLIWNLFMAAPEVKTGLKKLGFSNNKRKQ